MRVPLSLLPTIVVVGSKGKATAATKASAALYAAGHRLGTITSPPILTNRERIRVDGVAVDADAYEAIAARVEHALRTLPPPADGYLSPAGMYMVAGIDHLRREGCDVLVIEAGMGGGSDEVSLLDPQVLVVTPIFLEHVGILGNTLEEIRAEKLAAAGPRTVIVHDALEGARLIDPRATLDGMTIHLPGRMTSHVDRDKRRWLVDAAVNMEGVAAAIERARPEFALVSLPDGKDVSRTAEWLDRHLPGRWLAVIPPLAQHLSYTQWPRAVPWDPALVTNYRNVVAAGSWSFMSAVLAHLGVDNEVAFTR
ncbi:MAG: hypothetical protein ACJ74H_05395 [Thermoanaerobaculia bacterium]